MTKNPDWVNREMLKARRARRVPDGSACALCGETDKILLVRDTDETIILGLLEFHHVGGEANDPDAGGFLCANHHREATELQRLAGVVLDHDESRHELERIEAMLRSAAAFLGQIAAALIRAANYLAAFVRTFDSEQSEWRNRQVTDH